MTNLVVVSYYDRQPPDKLLRLLEQLRSMEAGGPFDVCVVVNTEGHSQRQELRLPEGVKQLKRENVGMNIGAWDHGWRSNPGYDDYLFLQDDCVVLRSGWLAGYRKRVRSSKIGLLGEALNEAWDKPWEKLRAEQEDVRMRGHELNGSSANRVDVYLDFFRRHGIPRGSTGRHLRSLVWFSRGDVLKRINGFPVGSTYGECIAAEIGVNKLVEAAGMEVRQVARSPFSYIGHEEWKRPARGAPLQKIEATSYAGQLAAATALLQLFLLDAKGPSALDSLRRRLLHERRHAEEGWTGVSAAKVTLLVEQSGAEEDIRHTLASWALQSLPGCESRIVPSEGGGALLDLDPQSYVVMARAGDSLHPSVGYAVALRAKEQAADVVVWNSVINRGFGPSLAVQRPQLQRFTLLNHDYIGRDMAVRARFASQYLGTKGRHLRDLALLSFKQWLAWNNAARWCTHPEFLALRRDFGLDAANEASNGVVAEFEPSGFDGDKNYLWPVRQPTSVTVIIPFRDKAELTLRAVRSVERQQFAGSVELILIDNASGRAERGLVEDGLTKLRPHVRNRILDFPSPFNHSRECNLGASAAHGDVLIFMNNDVELLSECVIDGLARWAALEGVASVGCRLLNGDGKLASAGIVARTAPARHHSPVEESREGELMSRIREVTGNTFALAAAKRDVFFSVGALDELVFPVGYNDVDYCLRAKQKGYTHIFLGPLVARHDIGASRGKTDESLQKLAIRERHTQLANLGLFEWKMKQLGDSTGSRRLPRSVSLARAALRRIAANMKSLATTSLKK